MSKRIVCIICGSVVMTFTDPEDVEPDRLFALLERELAKHRDVIDEYVEPLPADAAGNPPSDTEIWSHTLHLFQVVDEDNEAEDLEVELEDPELFFYGDMQGWW